MGKLEMEDLSTLLLMPIENLNTFCSSPVDIAVYERKKVYLSFGYMWLSADASIFPEEELRTR